MPSPCIASKATDNSFTAVERVTHTTKSLIIALAMVNKHLTVEDAALATQVEVASQIQRWGEVEDGELLEYRVPLKPAIL